MVAQPRKDRNQIVSDFLAFQQIIPVQAAYIDQRVLDGKSRPSKRVRHSERRLADIQAELLRKSLEQPVNAESVLRHSEGHRRIIAALQFQMDQRAIRGLTQQIEPERTGIGQLT